MSRRAAYVDVAVSRDISGAVTDSATTCTLDAALPATTIATFFAAVWNRAYTTAANARENSAYEVVKVSSYTSATINTMVRAQDGTTAIAWGATDWQFDVIESKTEFDIGATEHTNVKSAVYGALGDGTGNDATAIQAAIDATYANGGGVVYFPKGEYLCTAQITLPRDDSVSMTYRGAGRDATRILWSGLTTTDCITYESTAGNTKTIEDDVFEHMRFDRNDAGNIFKYVKYGSYGSQDNGEFRSTIRDCKFVNTAGSGVGNGDCIHISGLGIGCLIDNVEVQGGERGAYFDNGSYLRVNRLKARTKSTSPRLLALNDCGSSYISDCYAAGSVVGDGSYSYKLDNSGRTIIDKCQTEGDTEQWQIWIKDSHSTQIRGCHLGGQDDATSASVALIYINNSHATRVIGGAYADLSAVAVSPGGGTLQKSFYVDATSENNWFDGVTIDGGTPLNDIQDDGNKTVWLLYKEDSTPVFGEYTLGNLHNQGIEWAAVDQTSDIGTTTNFPWNLIQNGNPLARLSSSTFRLAGVDLEFGSGGPIITPGAGSPEGVVTADPGSIYLNTLGGSGTSTYIKESGTATNTGWAASGGASSYGEIYVNGGAAVETFTDQNTWYPLTSFAANGTNSGVTVDHTNDKITIDTAGDYEVVYSASFSGSASSTFEFAISIDGTEQTDIQARRVLGAGGDTGAFAMSGILTLAATEDVTVEGRCTSGASKTITVVHANLRVKKL